MRASARPPVSRSKRFVAVLALLALLGTLFPFGYGFSQWVDAGDEARWIGGVDDAQPAKLERSAKLENGQAVPLPTTPDPPANLRIATSRCAALAHAASVEAAPHRLSPASRRPDPTGPPLRG